MADVDDVMDALATHVQKAGSETRPAATKKPRGFAELEEATATTGWDSKTRFSCPPSASFHGFDLRAWRGEFRCSAGYKFNYDTGRWGFWYASIAKRPKNCTSLEWRRYYSNVDTDVSVTRRTVLWALLNPDHIDEGLCQHFEPLVDKRGD